MIVGIWLAHRDLVGVVGRVEKLYLGIIEDYRKKLAAADMKGIVGKIRQEDRIERLKDDEQKLRGLIDCLRYRIRTIEALILAAGTFIWAYGEMIAGSLWPL